MRFLCINRGRLMLRALAAPRCRESEFSAAKGRQWRGGQRDRRLRLPASPAQSRGTPGPGTGPFPGPESLSLLAPPSQGPLECMWGGGAEQSDKGVNGEDLRGGETRPRTQTLPQGYS